MADVFNYFGQALTLFAEWLTTASSPIPWPLFIALFFLPFVAAFRTWLWIMRGTFWPVTCKYFHTQQRRSDKACRTPVLGEWWYCRHHMFPKTMSDGHVCDPSIPRWQKRVKGRLLERTDIRGVGFISLISNRETLLFYKGISRRPWQIGDGIREIPSRARGAWQRLRSVRISHIFKRKESAAPLAVAERMPRVVSATRGVLTSFSIGLIAVVVSVLVRQPMQAVPQYCATMAFILAWEFLRFGVAKDPSEEERWMKSALVSSTKAFGVLIILALIGNILGGLQGDIQQ